MIPFYPCFNGGKRAFFYSALVRLNSILNYQVKLEVQNINVVDRLPLPYINVMNIAASYTSEQHFQSQGKGHHKSKHGQWILPVSQPYFQKNI